MLFEETERFQEKTEIQSTESIPSIVLYAVKEVLRSSKHADIIKKVYICGYVDNRVFMRINDDLNVIVSFGFDHVSGMVTTAIENAICDVIYNGAAGEVGCAYVKTEPDILVPYSIKRTRHAEDLIYDYECDKNNQKGKHMKVNIDREEHKLSGTSTFLMESIMASFDLGSAKSTLEGFPDVPLKKDCSKLCCKHCSCNKEKSKT